MNFAINDELIQSSNLLFEENIGQVQDSNIKFILRNKNFTLYFYNNKISINIYINETPGVLSHTSNEKFGKFDKFKLDIKQFKTIVDSIDILFKNSNNNISLNGENEQISKFNYFGYDLPEEGIVGVKTYSKIKYSNIYPNIDLIFYSNENTLEFDFVIKPGGNTNNIKLTFKNINSLTLDDNGNAIISTDKSSINLSKPKAYQIITNNKIAVTAEFIQFNESLCIKIGNYNHSKKLIIDPILYYSTYYGTSESTSSSSIAVSNEGDAYITGNTFYNGNFAAFVSKFDTNGNFIFSSIVYGNYTTASASIALDTMNNIYITGYTDSSDFPIIPSDNIHVNPPDGFYPGIFVTKFNPKGVVITTAFIHGTSIDYGTAIDVDNLNRPYITGFTYSALIYPPEFNFPVTDEFGTPFNTPSSGVAIFVIRLNDTVDDIEYSAIVHGHIEGDVQGYDYGYSIFVDNMYNAYVCGETLSSNDNTTSLPVTSSFGIGSAIPGDHASFVFKLGYDISDPTNLKMKYFIYINGDSDDTAYSVAVDSNYNAYITGYTNSGDTYPIVPPDNIPGSPPSNNSSVFVTKFNSTGDDIIYSCYLHGNGAYGDVALGITVDPSNNAYITGATDSSSFFTTNYFGVAPDGFSATFVTQLNSMGNDILYSAYLHGNASAIGDTGFSIALDQRNNFYATGTTDSTNFPTVRAYDSELTGSSDAFVVKFVTDSNILDEIYSEITNSTYGLKEIKSEVKIIEDTVLSKAYGLPVIYPTISSISININRLNRRVANIEINIDTINKKLDSILCLLNKLS